MNEENNKDETTEWEKFEKSKTLPVITSEYDHKIFILTPSIQDLDNSNILTFITKELETCFLDDVEKINLYQIQFENVLEWNTMGLPKLAEFRLAKLWGELKIEKSKNGFERLLQAGQFTGSIVTEIKKPNIFQRILRKREESEETLE